MARKTAERERMSGIKGRGDKNVSNPIS